jgi:hypothetical protein
MSPSKHRWTLARLIGGIAGIAVALASFRWSWGPFVIAPVVLFVVPCYLAPSGRKLAYLSWISALTPLAAFVIGYLFCLVERRSRGVGPEGGFHEALVLPLVQGLFSFATVCFVAIPFSLLGLITLGLLATYLMPPDTEQPARETAWILARPTVWFLGVVAILVDPFGMFGVHGWD